MYSKEKSGTQPYMIDSSSMKDMNVHESKGILYTNTLCSLQKTVYVGSNGETHGYDVKIIMQCVIPCGIIFLD